MNTAPQHIIEKFNPANPNDAQLKVMRDRSYRYVMMQGFYCVATDGATYFEIGPSGQTINEAMDHMIETYQANDTAISDLDSEDTFINDRYYIITPDPNGHRWSNAYGSFPTSTAALQWATDKKIYCPRVRDGGYLKYSDKKIVKPSLYV